MHCWDCGNSTPWITIVYNSTVWTLDTNVSNTTYLSDGEGDLEEDHLYEPPVGITVLLSIFYGSISVVAVVGNSLVMWIVATSRRMQNVTNCFIANLALADIVIGLFAIPFQFQAALLQRWNLPHFMCGFCPFVQVLSVNVSVFTLTAIAVDRHRAILNPLSARPSKLRAKLVVAAIWMVSAGLAAPMAAALGVTLTEVDSTGKPKPFCHNVRLSERAILTYRLVLVVLQYVTPLCIISVVYVRMALRLWGSRAPGNAEDSRDAALMRNKKKVIKMLVIVVALFALCWLPLQTYNVLQDIYPQINGYRYINIIWFCCDWLAMSNSCYNPFIYGIYNEKFKREFRVRLRLCSRRCWPSTDPGGSLARELSDLDKFSVRYNHSTSFHSWGKPNQGGFCRSISAQSSTPLTNPRVWRWGNWNIYQPQFGVISDGSVFPDLGYIHRHIASHCKVSGDLIRAALIVPYQGTEKNESVHHLKTSYLSQVWQVVVCSVYEYDICLAVVDLVLRAGKSTLPYMSTFKFLWNELDLIPPT
ncbi:RYamide receptor-like [Anabrus simplex]|uniref:RYamide receptor-like n=1 Tax=Anabrus simplex TaxID=316456 RepID=UPI0035A38824